MGSGAGGVDDEVRVPAALFGLVGRDMRVAFGSAVRNSGCSCGRDDDVLSVDGLGDWERSIDGRDGIRSR